MSLFKTITIIFFVLILISCNEKAKNNDSLTSTKAIATIDTESLSESKDLLTKTIAAHGGDLYNTAHYSFEFRGNTYYLKNRARAFQYKKISTKGDSIIQDILENNKFSRTINGIKIKLTDKEIASGTESINSVIYFATLPYKLNDEAVNSKSIETTIIKNIPYHVIEITFNKEGGGKDHDDVFYYWINKNTKKIDYLAYSYKVNSGGIRFRSAYNTRIIDGITFQDYINYKAEIDTPLKDLPKLYMSNKLKELSKIKTENIINLNKI